jgi:hypothetical protein
MIYPGDSVANTTGSVTGIILIPQPYICEIRYVIFGNSSNALIHIVAALEHAVAFGLPLNE